MRLPPRTIRSPPKDPKTIGDGRRGQAWSLVIPIAWFHLASENPIGISGVGQNDRDQDDCANKGKCKAAVGGGGFPDGERRWHHHRIEANPDADETNNKEAERRQEWAQVTLVIKPGEERPRQSDHQNGDNHRPQASRQIKPPLEIDWILEWGEDVFN